MFIHDHADGVRPDNVNASAVGGHGDADGCELRLPLRNAYADDGHHAYARGRVPRSCGYENGDAAL